MDFEGKLADLKESLKAEALVKSADDLKAVMTKLKKSDFINDHTKKVYGINAYNKEFGDRSLSPVTPCHISII